MQLPDSPGEPREFYKRLFTENPEWSTTFPNLDEVERLCKVLPMIGELAKAHYALQQSAFRIIDVGSGRGWLTSFLAHFGEAVGLEPVESVVQFARNLFPGVQFRTGVARTLLENPDFRPFDAAVCSEVIEHVPYTEQGAFLLDLKSLVKRGGNVILTTPRGEIFHQVKARYPDALQPIEAWLTESQLDSLLRACGLREVRRVRCRDWGAETGRTALLHRKPVRRVMSCLGYRKDTWNSTFYQVILAKRID